MCGDNAVSGSEGEGAGVGCPPRWELNRESKIRGATYKYIT